MATAIISDIHGNLPALEAVLDDITAAGIDEIWCLGDVVGYGAEPDGCAELVSKRCSLCLVGNHDLAVLGEIKTSSFSPAAAAAVHWTQENSSAATIEFLSALAPQELRESVALYHASPRDPVWEYVLWPDQAAECLRSQARRVSFVGHSHVALFFVLAGDGADSEAPTEERPRSGARSLPARSEARGAQASDGTELEIGEGRWLINPGSVGQPRDGDPRAAWLELDQGGWRTTYHRVAYEVDRAAEAILATDLPQHLAKRLYAGQ